MTAARRCCLPVLLFAPLLVAQNVAAANAPERTWFEQVERDRDRGAERIEDDARWELRRLRDYRIPVRREFERVDEERDRRLRIEARERRADRAERAARDDYRLGESVILSRPPAAGGVVMSPMAAQAAADERALADAKEKLDRSLRGVSAAEQRSLRSLKRRLNREGRGGEFDTLSVPVRQRHERLRAGHRGDYERVRSRILGRP